MSIADDIEELAGLLTPTWPEFDTGHLVCHNPNANVKTTVGRRPRPVNRYPNNGIMPPPRTSKKVPASARKAAQARRRKK